MDGNDYERVRLTHSDGVTTLTIDRAESRNSLDITTVQELATAAGNAMADEATDVIVVTGAGDDAFASGADIADFHEKEPLWFKRDYRAAWEDVEQAIEDGPKPVIAAVNGVAFGGGLELALMCDLVYVAESAVLGVPESSLGGMPGVGGTQRLTLLVGFLKAKELVFTGRPVPSEEAVDLGLANDVFPDEEFYDQIDDVATSLANGAPYAQWFAKEVINQTREGLDKGLALESALGAVLFDTDDIHEGFAAFIEGRDPDFSNWRDLDREQGD